jgi:hypothetical protein
MGSRQESISQALSSAEGLHALLKPGNRLVIVLPQGGTLMRAVNAALVHTLPHPLKSAVLTGDSDPQVSSTPVVSVADTKNINEALSRVRRHAAVHTLVVTGSSPFGSWDKKPLHLYDFYRKATRTLARSRARSIWLFEQERLSNELWAEIKEDAEFFATAFSSGPLTLFQFLTAKGFFSPWLFLPRPPRDRPSTFCRSRIAAPSGQQVMGLCCLIGKEPTANRTSVHVRSSDIPGLNCDRYRFATSWHLRRTGACFAHFFS